MLRLEIHGTGDDAAQQGAQREGGVRRTTAAPETSQSFTVLADRLTVEPGRLSLWHADELVFRLPVSALISIAFEAREEPRNAPSAGLPLRPPLLVSPSAAPTDVADPPEGPHGEPHRDLASANTRWTNADDGRLLELHATGVPIDALARTLGRRKGAVRARLFKLRHTTEDAADDPST